MGPLAWTLFEQPRRMGCIKGSNDFSPSFLSLYSIYWSK